MGSGFLILLSCFSSGLVYVQELLESFGPPCGSSQQLLESDCPRPRSCVFYFAADSAADIAKVLLMLRYTGSI